MILADTDRAGIGDGAVADRIDHRHSEQEGVGADRIFFRVIRGSHMQFYNEVDITLDPFPLTGGTSTCEALWMGVPVVTLAGPTHVSRVGASLLSSVGLEELVAGTPDDYVSRAVSLAGDAARLRALRAGMRARLRASPLMDAARFARAVPATSAS